MKKRTERNYFSYIVLEDDEVVKLDKRENSNGRRNLRKEEARNLVKAGAERGVKREAFRRVKFEVKL